VTAPCYSSLEIVGVISRLNKTASKMDGVNVNV